MPLLCSVFLITKSVNKFLSKKINEYQNYVGFK